MKPYLKWVISIFHAFLLLVFTVVWMNSNYTYGDEHFIIKWTSIAKRVIFKIDDDPPGKNYMFINLAYEKALIPREDALGNEVITDRNKLATFFKIIQRHQKEIPFVVCDVMLKGSSENDSLLQEAVKGLDNLVLPAQIGQDGKAEKLAINVPSAIADYKTVSGGFLKFKLFQHDSVKTLPVFLYEKLSKHQISTKNGMYFDNQQLMMNSMIIDYQIRPFELFEGGEYPVVGLSELLLLPENVIVNDFLKNRMVIMGDFNNDVHETLFGTTPGTLILLNVFLTLTQGGHIMSIWWICFLLVAYTLFSRLMLFRNNEEAGNNRITTIKLFIQSVSFLIVLSIVSYLFFGHHIQILIISLYISVLHFVLDLKKSSFSWKNISGWLIELRDNYFNFK